MSKGGAGRSSGSRRRSVTPSEAVRQSFYADNFLFLMGSAGVHLAAA